VIAGVAVALAIASNAVAETAPCEMTIEFATPSDWRCIGKDTDQCTVCQNVSDHASELVVRCVGDTVRQPRRIPPGAELSVCRGGTRPAVSPL
jgi:hypothetical protein